MPKMSENLSLDTFETLQTILNNYDLKLFNADSHRKIWRLETSEGLKYLKKSKLNPDELFFIAELLEFLTDNQFKTAPEYIKTRQGTPFAFQNNEIWVLTDWHQGEELNFEQINDLREATYFLAYFHLHAEGFHPSSPNFRTHWYSWPSKLENRLKDLLDFRSLAFSEKEDSAFSRLYLRYFEPFYRQAMESYERLLNSFYQVVAQNGFLRQCVCHHDYSGRNVMRNDERQLILVDFDYSLRDLRIHDLINLIVRNLKHNEWDVRLCRFILQEYHRIYPITPEEIEVLYVLLSWPQDFWQVGLQYYYEKLPWPQNRFIKKLEHKIDCRFQRARFLELFPVENGIFHWKESVDDELRSQSK